MEAEWHIYASVNYTITGSDNGLPPVQGCQAIIWTNAGILLIGPLGKNFSDIITKIHTFSLKNLYLKVSSAKVAAILSQPQCVKNIVMITTNIPLQNHGHLFFLAGKYCTYYCCQSLMGTVCMCLHLVLIIMTQICLYPHHKGWS